MIDQKVALITGAAGGIGRETALRYGREGYHLLLADIDAAGLRALEAELDKLKSDGVTCVIYPGDLTELDYVSSLVNKCRDQWGRLDVLVNNAIWRTHDTMRTISVANWQKTLAIGLTAPAFLARNTAALMEEKQLPGTIVNISSVMARRTGGTSPAYVVCKGGIESLTYELAALYGPAGIRVVAVAPGNVLTPLSGDFTDPSGEDLSARMEQNMNDQTPLQRSAHAREIANAIYWLSSEEASFLTGTVVEVDGGFSHGFNHYSLKKLQFPNEF